MANPSDERSTNIHRESIYDPTNICRTKTYQSRSNFDRTSIRRKSNEHPSNINHMSRTNPRTSNEHSSESIENPSKIIQAEGFRTPIENKTIHPANADRNEGVCEGGGAGRKARRILIPGWSLQGGTNNLDLLLFLITSGELSFLSCKDRPYGLQTASARQARQLWEWLITYLIIFRRFSSARTLRSWTAT